MANTQNKIDEASRKLPPAVKDKINQASDELAQQLYGSEYGKPNDRLNTAYKLSGKHQVVNNAQFDSGPFVVGNGKLSPDTLIINFTSALGCPSANDCPVSQMVCYAVAGENRLDDTRKKNVAIHDIWQRAFKANELQKMFNIAEMYIAGLSNTKNPIKFIRYNEAGDFPNMKYLQAAAAFSKKVKDEYGVLSMAYTAKKNLDFSMPLEGTDIPIDHIIKINASRTDIKRSSDVVNQQFFAVTMGFKEEIENNEKAEYVTFKDLDSLKYVPPTDNGSKNGIKSVPILQYGKWSGGEGYYYICPCSFMIRDKIRISAKYFLMAGLLPEYGVIENPDQATINDAAEKLSTVNTTHLVKKLSPEFRDMRTKEIAKLKSPCGVQCAVCHDMEGGLLPDGTRAMNYNVLTATHGALASNYNPEYSNAKRVGNDTVQYSKDNPHGYCQKFRSDAPIRSELLKGPEPGQEITSMVGENKQINEVKEKFWKMFNRINEVKF